MKNENMASRLLILMLGGLVLYLGCATEPFTPGYKPPESLFTTYDTQKEITFSGQIIREVGLIRGEEIPSTSIQVRTEKGKEYLVTLGPSWYLSMMKYSFEEGEMVAVTGAVHVEGMEERAPGELVSGGFLAEEETSEMLTIVLARKIKRGHWIITLRDKQGKPMWYKRGRSIGQKIYLERLIQEQKQKREELQEKEKEKEKYIY